MALVIRKVPLFLSFPPDATIPPASQRDARLVETHMEKEAAREAASDGEDLERAVQREGHPRWKQGDRVGDSGRHQRSQGFKRSDVEA